MAKHNRTSKEKAKRNLAYALMYRQSTCKDCGHKSCKPRRCAMCGGEMKA